jgi:hypothetical protein
VAQPIVRPQRTVLEVNTDKVTKLIKMLSSPSDGEIVAAARALMRTLESEGNDIHDLAKRIESNGGRISPAERSRIYEQERQRARQQAQRETAKAGPSFYEMACEIQRKEGSLTERERGFVADMVRWCARREPSDKQAKWLHSIYCRVGRS